MWCHQGRFHASLFSPNEMFGSFDFSEGPNVSVKVEHCYCTCLEGLVRATGGAPCGQSSGLLASLVSLKLTSNWDDAEFGSSHRLCVADRIHSERRARRCDTVAAKLQHHVLFKTHQHGRVGHEHTELHPLMKQHSKNNSPWWRNTKSRSGWGNFGDKPLNIMW